MAVFVGNTFAVLCCSLVTIVIITTSEMLTNQRCKMNANNNDKDVEAPRVSVADRREDKLLNMLLNEEVNVNTINIENNWRKDRSNCCLNQFL